MAKKILYTLNARDHVLLEVARDYFEIGPARMHHEIQGILARIEEILATKGIKYSGLKSALVPGQKRREIALVFDSQRIDNNRKGFPIYEALIPLFFKQSNHSILAGDYIGDNDRQGALYEAFCDSVEPVREVVWRHSNQFFIVYINNLTKNMIKTFHEGLIGFEAYVGFADMTFASRFKIYLSTMLVNDCIKHRNIVLMGHEDDRDNKEDVNMRSYPWEDSGYTCRSLQDMYFGVLLSYKIERPVFKGFETDTEFSINAVSPDPLPIADFELRIDENKLSYLAAEKAGTLKRIGLLTGDLSELKSMIAAKISSNYIYNMEYDEQRDIAKFNIILETRPGDGAPPQRVLAALEYIPHKRCLRLITLY
jgi:hypothetical protein